MKHSIILKIVLPLLFAASLSCIKDDKKPFIFKAMENVTYTVNTNELEYNSDLKSVFLYFELIIENTSNEDVFLDVGKIQANLNGELSAETYYDSLASVMPEKERLNSGRTENKLYFVFPEILKNAELKDFKIINYGLSNN